MKRFDVFCWFSSSLINTGEPEPGVITHPTLPHRCQWTPLQRWQVYPQCLLPNLDPRPWSAEAPPPDQLLLQMDWRGGKNKNQITQSAAVLVMSQHMHKNSMVCVCVRLNTATQFEITQKTVNKQANHSAPQDWNPTLQLQCVCTESLVHVCCSPNKTACADLQFFPFKCSTFPVLS